MTAFATALAELGAVTARIDPAQIDRACARIAGAPAIVAHAAAARGAAARLRHAPAPPGLRAAMQGDMTAPPLGPGDLFLCSAGPGELATVTALMQVARGAGAGVLFLTAEPETPSAALADELLVIPAQTMARDRGGASVLPMGSLYEGALFLLFEIMVLDLRDRLGETAASMRARHTNME